MEELGIALAFPQASEVITSHAPRGECGMQPGPRRTDVTVQELGKETMVYDPIAREFHLLNEVAAFTFTHADGSATIAGIAGMASEQLGRNVAVMEIEAALVELDRVRLLEQGTEEDCVWVSRRDAVRRLGAVAVLALPFITTVLAPSTAMAKSHGDYGPPNRPKSKGSRPSVPNPPGRGKGSSGRGTSNARSNRSGNGNGARAGRNGR